MDRKCYPEKNKNCWTYMPPGSRIERYVVLRHIHEKPVFFARDKKTGEEVVLKRAEPIYGHKSPHDPHRLARICLQYEADLQKRIRHSNVSPVHGVVEHKGRHYIVTPSVGPKNFYHHVTHNKPPTEEKLMILEDIANALTHSHDNSIVHLDIKERNVIVKDKKGILIDFGAAREYGIRHPIVDEFIVTTPDCGAPEYIHQGVFSPRSDTFSFAYMAFWALTGNPAYKTETRPMYSVQLFHPLSLASYNGFGDLIIAGLNKDPGRRPPINEIASAIKEHTARQRRQQNAKTSEPSPASC